MKTTETNKSVTVKNIANLKAGELWCSVTSGPWVVVGTDNVEEAKAFMLELAPELLKALQHIASLSDLKNAPMQSDAWHAWLIATHAVVEATGEAQ